MKIKIGLLALALSTILVGCSDATIENNDSTNKPSIEENKDTHKDNKEQEINKEEIENSNKNNVSINKEKEEPIEKLEEINKENINIENTKGKIDFKLYTFDSEDTDKRIILKDIHNINKDDTLENKINALLLSLKKDYFKDDKANIQLESINDGIVTINLIDENSWRTHFQGSTGGYINQKTIVETLLQRDYDGDWIKGVDVLIDGKKQEVFDHASFEEIFYR